MRNQCLALRHIRVRGVLGGLLGATVALGAFDASAQSVVDVRPFAAQRFATLPMEADSPEGLTANPRTGQIFVDTFDAAPGVATNFLLRYSPSGQLEAQLPFGTAPLLGLAFNPRDGMVYIARPGTLIGEAPKIQRVRGDFDASSSIEDVAVIPDIPAPAPRVGTSFDGLPITTAFPDSFALPNGLEFRQSNGDLLVTDSLQAAIFRIADPTQAANLCPSSSACVSTLIQDTLLASGAFPALGVNSAVFSQDETRLFITNTGDDRLLVLDMASGALSILAETLEGADGLARGPGNIMFVSVPLADEILAIDGTTGRIVAELCEFLGIRRDGSGRGLLFPGSIVRVGNSLFASNLAFRQTNTPAEPEGDVRVYTLSRIRLPQSVLQAR